VICQHRLLLEPLALAKFMVHIQDNRK
jgi:hypothetical protein